MEAKIALAQTSTTLLTSVSSTTGLKDSHISNCRSEICRFYDLVNEKANALFHCDQLFAIFLIQFL